MKICAGICCACLLLMASTAIAQQPVPEKDLVIVDFFSRSRVVPAPYVETLRGQVIQAFIDRGRQQVIDDQFYDLTATAPIAQDADMAALARLRGSMDFYVSSRFKIETVILQLCPADRKGRIRELYIHSGNQTGVQNGDLFVVWEEVPIGGVISRQKIGKLRVNDATSPDVAKCKIAAGDQEIVQGLSQGRPMICISDGKVLFY